MMKRFILVGSALQVSLILSVFQNTGTLSIARNDSTQNNTSTDVEDVPTPHNAPEFPNPYTRTLLAFVHILVGTIALLSNALIIHVVRINLHMRTSTNYIIVNMACGDLMAIIVSVPGATYYLYYGQEWAEGILGTILCKFKYFAFYVSLFCSIFSLVAISFDRFMAVVRPLAYASTSTWSRMTFLVVWLTSLALPCHYAFNKISLIEYNQIFYCTASDSPGDAYAFISVGFLFPHVVMVVFYVIIAIKLCRRRIPGEPHPSTSGTVRNSGAHKTARKVTYMIICIIVAFDICWAPVFFLYIGPYIKSTAFHFSPIASIASKILMISNGVSNALIYAVFNETYRHAFQQVLHCKKLTSVFRRYVFQSSKVRDEQTGKHDISGQRSNVKSRSGTLITKM